MKYLWRNLPVMWLQLMETEKMFDVSDFERNHQGPIAAATPVWFIAEIVAAR
ncbi:MAG: hypothetical protein ABW145_16950 [Candidatus Thiodiazotropha sp.]